MPREKYWNILRDKYIPLFNKYQYFWNKNEDTALLSFLFNNESIILDDLLNNGKTKREDILKKWKKIMRIQLLKRYYIYLNEFIIFLIMWNLKSKTD